MFRIALFLSSAFCLFSFKTNAFAGPRDGEKILKVSIMVYHSPESASISYDYIEYTELETDEDFRAKKPTDWKIRMVDHKGKTIDEALIKFQKEIELIPEKKHGSRNEAKYGSFDFASINFAIPKTKKPKIVLLYRGRSKAKLVVDGEN